MSYFLTEEKLAKKKVFEIIGEEARHLVDSLHAKIGEKFTFQDIDKKRFEVVVLEVGRNSLKCEVVRALEDVLQKKTKINIYQGLIAEKALDFLIQKATELGAHKMVIFPADNSYIKKVENINHKLARWQKISLEAAKQSERPEPLKIELAKNIEEGLELLIKNKVIVLADPRGGVLNEKDLKEEIGCLIGPEGGFSKKEKEQIEKITHLKLKLSPNILRAETAGIAALAVLEYLTD